MAGVGATALCLKTLALRLDRVIYDASFEVKNFLSRLFEQTSRVTPRRLGKLLLVRSLT